MSRNIYGFNRIFGILLIFFVSALGVTPDSAVIQITPQYLVSVSNWGYPRATMVLSVFDSVGNPVPENTPVAISAYNENWYGAKDQYFTPQMFKRVEGGGNSPSYTFFYTNAQGQVIAEFAAGELVFANDSSYLNLGVHAVDFTDPQDPQTAQARYTNILDAGASQLPVLLGLGDYQIQTISGAGDEYVYEWKDVPNPDSARVELTVLDSKGNPVPENVPVAIYLFYPGKIGFFDSNQLFYQEYSPYSGGQRWDIQKYYFFTDASGKIVITFHPANTGVMTSGHTAVQDLGVMPWHFWYNLKKANYNSEAEAFADWKLLRTIPIEVRAISMRDTSSPYPINKQLGEIPVLVGPDQYTVQVVGKENGNHYLFTNKSKVESAVAVFQFFDDVGRPILPGSPIAFENGVATTDAAGTCGRPKTGIIISLDGTGVDYQPNDCGDPGVFAETRTTDNGMISLKVFPPHSSLRWEWPNSINEYSIYYLHPSLKDQSWGVDYTLTRMTNSGSLPILTSPGSATAQFSPPALMAFQLISWLKIRCLDTQNRPVPKGTTIYASVNYGTLKNFTDKTAEIIIGNDGTAVIPYFSPTRGVNDSYNDVVTIYKDILDPSAGPGGSLLGSATIHLEGIAINPFNFSLSKLIFGKNFSDVLNDLNPVKALGSMRRMSDAAKKVNAAKIRLYDVAANPEASDADYQQAVNDYLASLNDLKQTIGEFIKDVPGTSFDPNLPFSAQGAVESIVNNGVRHYVTQQVKDKIKSGIESNFRTYILLNKIRKNKLNSTLNKISQKTATSDTLLIPDVQFDIASLSPIHFLDGTTGMEKAYGYQLTFNVKNLSNLDSIIVAGDQIPLGKFFLPDEVTLFFASAVPVISPGIIEITSIDTLSGHVDAVILGIITGDQNVLSDILTEAVVTDTASTTLSWPGTPELIFPPSAVDFTANVTDSVHFFIGQMVPPNPLREADSMRIQVAYAIGSFSLPDSTIQSVTLNTPAVVKINRSQILADTSLYSGSLLLYKYDDQNRQWVNMDTLTGYSSDTLAVEIVSTGIYGIGGKAKGYVPLGINDGGKHFQLPERFELKPAYPNPFNPVTTIEYQVPVDIHVTLTIYNLMGQKIATLVDKKQTAGYYTIKWNARQYASGLYFIKMQAGQFNSIQKIVLMK